MEEYKDIIFEDTYIKKNLSIFNIYRKDGHNYSLINNINNISLLYKNDIFISNGIDIKKASKITDYYVAGIFLLDNANYNKVKYNYDLNPFLLIPYIDILRLFLFYSNNDWYNISINFINENIIDCNKIIIESDIIESTYRKDISQKNRHRLTNIIRALSE